MLRVLEPRLWSKGEREQEVSVHPQHVQKTRRYFGKVRCFSRVFIFSMLLGCAATFVFLAFRWLPGLSATVVYLGIIMWLFPFATPTTVEMMGIRNSVGLARASAVLFIAGGILLLFL